MGTDIGKGDDDDDDADDCCCGCATTTSGGIVSDGAAMGVLAAGWLSTVPGVFAAAMSESKDADACDCDAAVTGC